MTIGVSGRRDVREVTEIAKREIQEVLPKVPGVGRVFLSGGRTRAINVVLDIDQLIVLRAVGRGRAAGPAHAEPGSARRHRRSKARASWCCARWAGSTTAAEFDELIVANRNGYPIRIKDVGRAEDSVEEPRGLTRHGRRERRQPVHPEAVGHQHRQGVRRRAGPAGHDRASGCPPTSTSRSSTTSRASSARSMEEVKFHLLLAAVLVSLTILLFIRDWRTTLIATLAIPTSIIPTFLFMSRMGFTLNNITMLALILAIGIVIDDAVVVHENIFRHMEEGGLDAMAAARKGTKEIALAVLATSLSLVVIFLPVAFMGGHGRPVLQQLRHDRGLRDPDEPVRLVHADADALLAVPEARAVATAGHAKSKSGFVYRSIDWFYGRALRLVAAPSLRGRAGVRRRRGLHRPDRRAAWASTSCRATTRASSR